MPFDTAILTPEEIRRRAADIDWWHTIDLGHGFVTPGRGGSPALLERMRMPDSLAGQTVLDIGAFDGAFSFEAERRGAARIVALDHRVPPGFALAHQALQSRVEFEVMDVRDMTPERPGVFDVVFFMGVLYHLPDPVRALERVHAVTRRLAIIETDGALDWVTAPAAEFVGSREALSNSALNWWLPNTPCFVEMIRAGGFSRVEMVWAPRPAPRTITGKILRRAWPSRYAPRSSRLIAHAYR